MQSSTRGVSRGHSPRSVGAVLLAFISVTAQMVALAAATGWAPGLLNHQPRARMAAALIRSAECGGALAGTSTCVAGATIRGLAGMAQVRVPQGSKQCPASGPGASCAYRQAVVESGTSAVPDGMPSCPVDSTKSYVEAPGSCNVQAVTPAPVAVEPAADPGGAAQPVDPASDAPLVDGNPIHRSAPQDAAPSELTLASDKANLAYGSTVILDATASFSVSDTPWAIEIFDQTKGVLVGACTQSNECKVAYTGRAGVHSFVAFVALPTNSLPTNHIHATSNVVEVRWLGIGLVAGEPTVVAPGKPVTFTAYASEEVSSIGYRIEMRDATSGQQLTYCSYGTTCSTSLVEQASGVHAVTASLEPESPGLHAGTLNIRSDSGAVYGTWMGLHLDATATSSSQGGVVWLTATANADLSSTPWSIYIFSQSGQQVGDPCHATSCSGSVSIGANDSTQYMAVIAAHQNVPNPSSSAASAERQPAATPSVLDIQVSSPLIKPMRILWGVDSCRAFTQDPAGNSGVLPEVVSAYGGAPDFWGRYLTTTYNCPGLSPAEMMAAHSHHMGILPIYDDYDCSAVQGYSVGLAYAQAAGAQMIADGIPARTGVAVDIEPPGAACPGASFVDPGFLKGWYDGITGLHYQPIYYGDATPGSAFQRGWCTLIGAFPDIANTSYVWSFEPSLLGSYSKATAPEYAPNALGCGGLQYAWQYELSAGSTPDVDTDEALSRLPLWYP